MLQILVVQLVVPLIILAVVFWGVNKFPTPPILKQIAEVVIVVIGVLILINLLLALSGGGHLSWK